MKQNIKKIEDRCIAEWPVAFAESILETSPFALFHQDAIEDIRDQFISDLSKYGITVEAVGEESLTLVPMKDRFVHQAVIEDREILLYDFRTEDEVETFIKDFVEQHGDINGCQ